MRTLIRSRTALALAATLSLSAAALADATIDGELQVTVKKGAKFVVEADVTMSDRGSVTLQGTLAGTPYQLTKKFKTRSGRTRTRTIRLTVDPKKLGVRDQTDTVVLTAQMTAAEDGQAEPAVAVGGGVIPPPLMLVPGLGSELDQRQFDLVFDPFIAAVNEQAGGVWNARGKRATIRVQKYFSTSFPIEQLGAFVAKQGEKMLKKNRLFARMDLIGQSTGGLVVRQAMLPVPGAKRAPSLAGDVRHVFFFGTPNSGTPVAYLAEQALELTRDLPNGIREAALAAIEQQLVGSVDSPSASSLAALLLRPARRQGDDPPFLHVVRLFLPTNPFAIVPVGPGQVTTLDYASLTALAGAPARPVLEGLNSADPDPGAIYHALYYSDVFGATGDVRTVDGLNLVDFLVDGTDNLALIQAINGPGDGVASEQGILLAAHPQWDGVMNGVDLGVGLHFPNPDFPTAPGYYNDPQVFGYVLPRLLSPLPLAEIE